MRSQIVNYKNRSPGHRRGRLVNVGFFLHQVPRPLLACALLGHRCVVDGYDSRAAMAAPPADFEGRRLRWVVCSRCGDRPTPQGALDPDRWNLGEKYTGCHGDYVDPARYGPLKDLKFYPPGPYRWNDARGELGGQVIVGRQEMGIGFGFKIGNGGSEQPLAAHLHLGLLGALYLHTGGGIGRGVQRRLNPDRPGVWNSRVVEVALRRGTLSWKVWAKRDEYSRTDPWWQQGRVNLRPLDVLLGPKRVDHRDVPGGVATRIVRMPEGDYLVGLKLQQVTVGRRRGRRRRLPYEVDWSALGKGIPTEGPLRGRTFGASVAVSDPSVDAGTWAAEAAAKVAAQVAMWRTREGWEPTGLVQVDTVPADTVQVTP
jgi:hypothetical protein